MTRKELFRRLQAKQDAERSRRAARIVRAIKGVGARFFDDELGVIEQTVEQAYGRVKLNRG